MKHSSIAWAQRKNALESISIDGLNFNFLEKTKSLLESTFDPMRLNALNDFQSCINLQFLQHQIHFMQILWLILLTQQVHCLALDSIVTIAFRPILKYELKIFE